MQNDSTNPVYDDLLNEAVQRFRDLPIPDDPGIADLQFLELHRPVATRTSRSNSQSGWVAMASVAIVLLVGLTGVMQSVNQEELTMIADQSSDEVSEVAELTAQVAEVTKIDPGAQFRAMESELDHLSDRLDRIDQLIARKEFLRETATLLAVYELPKQTNQ